MDSNSKLTSRRLKFATIATGSWRLMRESPSLDCGSPSCPEFIGNVKPMSRFGLTNRGIPDAIVKPIFFRRRADLLENRHFDSFEGDRVAHPRRRICFPSAQSHIHLQPVLLQPLASLDTPT